MSPHFFLLQLSLVSSPGLLSFQHAAQLELHFSPETTAKLLAPIITAKTARRHSLIVGCESFNPLRDPGGPRERS